MTNRKYSYLSVPLLIIISIILFFVFSSQNVNLKNDIRNPSKEKSKQIINENFSSISGLPCKNYNRRPFAVMLAEDEVARPLSGLQAADLVVEMPVLITGMNRMMAIYVCGDPPEIGSIRSARHDFIPIVMGFDAIFAHWGGSHFALDKLNNGIMDNIDALKYSRTAFWRQINLPSPHNGFTSIEKLSAQAEKLGYRLENEFEGYKHQGTNYKIQDTRYKLTINYPGIYKVWWEYNPETNEYLRWRGNGPEKDFNTANQVKAKNIVVMRAQSHYLEDQYNDVDVEGEGEASFYFAGKEIEGSWKKEGHYEKTKLYFYDEAGSEIEFVPGQIWIEIIEPEKQVTYEMLK